ncbi:ABC transporter ATP-binding protein [Microlunatus parietis]|uniref:Peptide/nickel transport system ATP-binding protein n=1 Tax=Microlunatus parietis TaxID=682979 RepID=A0A7Y9I3U2_9ACTN|nr:ABC transporter ATP-binding protein [Microlunatus parietis]NYE69761.1 peptide/nickel transport system ATP-binding protein [Microlunatus parietis]
MTDQDQQQAGRQPVLEAVGLTKHFEVTDRFGQTKLVRALEEADLALHPGKTVGLVGESGSGKTTLARLLALFHPATSGEIKLDGRPVSHSKDGERDYYRQVQLIFQDPFASLNPLKTVRYTLGRALRIHGHARKGADLEDKIIELLGKVNLTPAETFIDKLPHELSGGQRQRVVIARALAVQPKVLLGDEPISMLDVSIRLDVLNLLANLRDSEDLALLYITHDIASARYLCDSITVLYAGQLVEGGPVDAVIQQPRHPYTRLLLDSSPDPGRTVTAEGRRAGLFELEGSLGEPPNLSDPPPGCRFHPRCPFAMDECRTELPARTEFPDGHWARCWLHQKQQSHLLQLDEEKR